MDETRQFLILSAGLFGLADVLVFLSIMLGVNEKIEVIGYGLAVLGMAIIAGLGGKVDGKTTNTKTLS